MKSSKSQSGFTLVEMVVAVGLFSIVSVLIAQLFVLFNRSQIRSSLQQQVQSDARIMMAQISDRIRAGSIDYASYAGGTITSPETTLLLLDENGLSVTIAQSSSDTLCPSAQAVPCLLLSEDGGSTFTPLSSENFTVDTVNFYIDPSTDPAEPAGPNIQPRVTFSLELTGISNDPAQQVSTTLQTTVSSRVYFR